MHLCLSPGPAVVVQHHHAGALGKCLHDAHVRSVGTSRDIEEEEAREEEEDGKVLELQKILIIRVDEGLTYHDYSEVLQKRRMARK